MPTGRTTFAYDPEVEAARQAELAKQAQFAGLLTPSAYADALFVPPDAGPPPPPEYVVTSGGDYTGGYQPAPAADPYIPSSTYDPALSPSAYQPQNPYAYATEPVGGNDTYFATQPNAQTVNPAYSNPPPGSAYVPYDANQPPALQSASYVPPAPPPPPAPSTLYGGPSGMLPSRPDQIQTSYPAAGASPYNTLYNNPLGTRQGAPPPYDDSQQPSNPYATDRFAHRRELAELYQGAGEPQLPPPPISMLGMTDDLTGMPGVPPYAQQPGVMPLPATGENNWGLNWDQYAQDIIDGLAPGDRAGGFFGDIGNLLFPAEDAYAKVPEGTGGGGVPGRIGAGTVAPRAGTSALENPAYSAEARAAANAARQVGANPRPGTAPAVGQTRGSLPTTEPIGVGRRSGQPNSATVDQQFASMADELATASRGYRGYRANQEPAGSYTAPRSAEQVARGGSAASRAGINAQGGIGGNPYGPRATLTQQARSQYTPPSEHPGMRQAIGSGYGRNTAGVGGLARGAVPRGSGGFPGGRVGLGAAGLVGAGLSAGVGLGLIDNVQFGGSNPYVPVTERWRTEMWDGPFPTTAPTGQKPAPASDALGQTTSREPISVITLDTDGTPLLSQEGLQANVKGGSNIRALTAEDVAALVASGVQISEKAAQDLLIGKRVVIPDEWQAILSGAAPAPSVADATVPGAAGTTSSGTSSGGTSGGSDTYYDGGSSYGGYGGYRKPTENSGYGYDLPPLPEGFGTGGGMFPGEMGNSSDEEISQFEQMMGDPMFARYFEIFSKAMGPDRARLFMRRFGRNFKGMDRAYRSVGKRTKTTRGKRTPSLATESASAERKPTTPDNATMHKQIRRDVAKRTGTKPKKDAA